MTSFYLMHRGWMDHPLLASEDPYTKREAWCWLIENAAFSSARKQIGSMVLDLKRGQLAASLRYMAKAWRWEEPKVRRFLTRLKTDAMIDAASDAGITVITIRNYEVYQTRAANGDAASDAQTDADATQQRRSNDANNKEGKEIKEDSGGGGVPHETANTGNGGTVRQPTEADAKLIVAAFTALRDELWPRCPNFPAPAMTLQDQALAFLKAGGTVPLITELLERGMRKAAAEGKTATGSLKAFQHSITDAIASHRAGIQTSGGNHATSPRRSGGQRSFEDEIRAIDAAVDASRSGGSEGLAHGVAAAGDGDGKIVDGEFSRL